MGFREKLEHICHQVNGSLAASVMGYDGIAVDSYEVDPGSVKGASPDVNINSAMVEYSSIFGQIRTAAANLQAGDAAEFSILTQKVAAVGRAVSPDYFVVIALTPDGNIGKARYALRIGAGQLAAEL